MAEGPRRREEAHAPARQRSSGPEALHEAPLLALPAPRPVPEAPRDQGESELVPLLRWLLAMGRGGLQAVVLVDEEGECVDYCSALLPFEAKVAAAQWRAAWPLLQRAVEKLGGGALGSLLVSAQRMGYLLRPLDEHYLLVAVGTPGAFDQRLLRAVERAVEGLRALCGIGVPPWSTERDGLWVRVERREGELPRPRAFGWGARSERITCVLGTWRQRAPALGSELVGFRVRGSSDREYGLLYDPGSGRWGLLP